MKKIGLYLASLSLSIVFLTSCMKGSNVWEGIVLGVIGLSENFTPVIKTSAGDLYSSSLITSMNDGKITFGDCYVFYIRVDSDLPENSPNVVATYGYQTVTILDQLQLSKYTLQYGLTDTTTVLPGEVPIVKAFDNNADYIEGILFLVQTVNIPEGWELSWDMSYNPNTMMPTTEGSNRYYDLYVRAIVTKEGTNTNKTDRSFTNAYQIYSYLTSVANTEKQLLGSSYNANVSKFIIRFKFPSSIDKDTNTITWSSNQIENLYVASFQTMDQ